jgi:hypothetical protein
VGTASQRKGVGYAPATQKTAPALIDRHPTDQPDRRQQPIPAYVLLNAQERFVGTLALPRQVSWDCLVSFRGCRYSVLLSMVGLARTRFAGRTPRDLRHAIETAATTAEGRFASPGEMAVEAIPQLARSMIHLPLRRILRYARTQRQAGSPSA